MDHRSTAAVNGGGPPVNHRWTTFGPPPDRRSMVVDRKSRRVNSWAGSVLGRVKSGHGPGRIGSGLGLDRVGSWAGSGSSSGRHVASPEWATCHERENPHPKQAWANINEQQHTEQSEPSYDTHLLETIDSNTTPTSTNMCHRGGEIDQDALLKTELLKTKDMVDKEIYNELSKRFLQL
ncbi:hypothetical protein Tco_0190046, partial [Tanacetum coccineum]